MKLVIIEPLGVEKNKLMEIADNALKDRLEIVYYDDRETDKLKLISRGRDADIIIVANQPLDADVIGGFEKLKYLSVAFTGIDHIALDAVRRRNILITNCAGYSNSAVADLVFGMLIAYYRNISACDAAVRAGKTKDGLIGPELEGKKFGIVGTGAIGMRVAEIAKAFGCEVLAYSRTVKDVPWISYMSLEELLRESDVVSLHVPSNAETYHLINEDSFKLMKKSAVLINCARGPVVDNEALAEALRGGVIGGALIDVFDMEPPLKKDYPLLSCPRTLLTPHVAFATDEAMIKRAKIVFDNVAKYLDGTPQNVV